MTWYNVWLRQICSKVAQKKTDNKNKIEIETPQMYPVGSSNFFFFFFLLLLFDKKYQKNTKDNE
jgi:hypothetical protein